VEIQSVEMLTLNGGLCCVGSMNPVGVVAVSGDRDCFLLGPSEWVLPEDGNKSFSETSWFK
jgi:hypothetical protein